MDELTISQIKDITGWSYPTALKFATKHGRQDEAGIWHVPGDILDGVLRRELEEARVKVQKLNSMVVEGAAGR